jgi:16S rRNA (guanine527-N7)-methyltransferase
MREAEVSRETEPTPERLAELFPGSEREIALYAALLTSVGVERGALGPREADRIWERHLLNCRRVADFFAPNSEVLDVGSGAGLPGLVIALARPDLRIILLEPLLRRTTLLTEFVEALGVGPRVSVIRSRAEDHHHQYRYVTSRAVARLEKLLPICWPLIAPEGTFLALKGEGATSEVAAAAPLLARLKVKSVEVIETAGYPEAPQPGRVIRIER